MRPLVRSQYRELLTFLTFCILASCIIRIWEVLLFPPFTGREHAYQIIPRAHQLRSLLLKTPLEQVCKRSLAPSENRTRGSTMATLNFTTKPMVLWWSLSSLGIEPRSSQPQCDILTTVRTRQQQVTSGGFEPPPEDYGLNVAP